MFREEERKRLQAEEHEVQKVKDAHQNMLQQVSDSLPPEPASGSAGVFVALLRKIIVKKIREPLPPEPANGSLCLCWP